MSFSCLKLYFWISYPDPFIPPTSCLFSIPQTRKCIAHAPVSILYFPIGLDFWNFLLHPGSPWTIIWFLSVSQLSFVLGNCTPGSILPRGFSTSVSPPPIIHMLDLSPFKTSFISCLKSHLKTQWLDAMNTILWDNWMFLVVWTSWAGAGLTQIFETSAGMAGTVWGLSPCDLSSFSWPNWAPSYGGGKTPQGSKRGQAPMSTCLFKPLFALHLLMSYWPM